MMVPFMFCHHCFFTLLPLLLPPFDDDWVLVLPPPPYRRLRSPVGLAKEGGVVVLAHANGGGRTLEVVDLWRN